MGEVMDRRIRVLIADDHPRSRKGLRVLLRTNSAIEVIGEATNGREAVELIEELEPDVVLMDIQMPVCDGLEAIQHLRSRGSDIKIIALTVHATFHAPALSAGADAFVLKGCPSEELFAAIDGSVRHQPAPEATRAGIQSEAAEARGTTPRPGRLAAAALVG
jgi:DNA-binding NarL/FixJ family response regulator